MPASRIAKSIAALHLAMILAPAEAISAELASASSSHMAGTVNFVVSLPHSSADVPNATAPTCTASIQGAALAPHAVFTAQKTKIATLKTGNSTCNLSVYFDWQAVDTTLGITPTVTISTANAISSSTARVLSSATLPFITYPAVAGTRTVTVTLPY